MIVAMIAVRVVQMATDQIVDVVAMRHRLVAASRSMPVGGVVSAAAMVRRAAIGISGAYSNDMLIDMVVMRVMQMAIMEIVGVSIMANRNVAATRPMRMRVIGMNGMIVRDHDCSFPRSALVRCVIDSIPNEIENMRVGNSVIGTLSFTAPYSNEQIE